MKGYTPLFYFLTEHGFYDDGLAHGLDFVPSERTANVLKNTGLLIKSIRGGIAVLYDNGDTEALKQYAQDKSEPLNFVFKVYAQDAAFKSQTVRIYKEMH